MNACIKRIILDIKDLDKSPIENIYYFPDEDDIHNGYALIIGPKNTPYQYGNYLFNFKFTEEYPFNPPKVTYLTNDGITRFNPNLYRNGKVCLSILNTWTGEKWSACQSIRSILITLQITLNEYPLLNEPGIVKPKYDNEINLYNELLYYKNIEFTILHYLLFPDSIPVKNEEIKDIIKNKFLENKDNILEYIKKNINFKKNINLLNIYDLKTYVNYDYLLNKYNKLKLN